MAYQCNRCVYEADTLDEIQDHFATKHAGATPRSVEFLKCPYCDCVSADKKYQIAHMESIHPSMLGPGAERPAWKQISKQEENVMPPGQGKRTVARPRHDLIPLGFLDDLAAIFEEGLPKYGDSWKAGGDKFIVDCLNHASNHLFKFMNGDYTEDQLAKVAWNALVVNYFFKRDPQTTDMLKVKARKTKNES